MVVTATEVIAIGIEVFQIAMQVYKAVNKVLPEIEELYESWKTLAASFLDGTDISEEQIQELRAKIVALSNQNAALEDAIINGTAS